MSFSMVRTCCVPDCISNNRSTYYEGTSTLLFSFPRDDCRKAQWLLSIPKSDFQLYRDSAVCLKHFEDRFIVRESKVERTNGREMTVKTGITLTDDAVPTLFSSQTKNTTKRRRRFSKQKNNEFKETYTKRRECGRSTKILDNEEFEKLDYITCCAQACTNTSKNHVLIRLPWDADRRQEWIRRINREDWTPSKYSALCQIHFEADVWEKNAFGEKVLKDDFLPTLNLHGDATNTWVTFGKCGKFKDGSNITSDRTVGQESESSVCIKQEDLDSDVEILEETPRMMQPFEAVYLHSNFRKQNGILIQNINLKVDQVETIVPDILPEIVKPEPLGVTDDLARTISTLSCPECEENFEEKWNFELHLREKHSVIDRTHRLINEEDVSSSKPTKVYGPSLQAVSSSMLDIPLTSSLSDFTSTTTMVYSSTSSEVEGTQRDLSTLVSTSQSITSPITLKENSVSNQHLGHITVMPTFLSEDGYISTVVPTLPQTPTSSKVDSSEIFSISLAEFSESQRLEIKKEIWEVIEMWKKKKFALK